VASKHSKTVERICEHCSSPFMANAYEVNKGNARFCKMACFQKSRPLLPDRKGTLSEVLWARVDKSNASGCWVWTGARKSGGYGHFHHRDHGLIKAHRASWIVTNGEIPAGLIVCHKCDNPPCVNPSHLFLGTKKDNTRDMMAKGRAMFRGEPYLAQDVVAAPDVKASA
jgi:hypothetical protein